MEEEEEEEEHRRLLGLKCVLGFISPCLELFLYGLCSLLVKQVPSPTVSPFPFKTLPTLSHTCRAWGGGREGVPLLGQKQEGAGSFLEWPCNGGGLLFWLAASLMMSSDNSTN